MGQRLDSDMPLNFHGHLCEIFDEEGEKQMAVKMRDHSSPLKWKTTSTTTLDESILWYKRFGHCNYDFLKQMQKNKMVLEIASIIADLWSL